MRPTVRLSPALYGPCASVLTARSTSHAPPRRVSVVQVERVVADTPGAAPTGHDALEHPHFGVAGRPEPRERRAHPAGVWPRRHRSETFKLSTARCLSARRTISWGSASPEATSPPPAAAEVHPFAGNPQAIARYGARALDKAVSWNATTTTSLFTARPWPRSRSGDSAPFQRYRPNSPQVRRPVSTQLRPASSRCPRGCPALPSRWRGWWRRSCADGSRRPARSQRPIRGTQTPSWRTSRSRYRPV
jgi:hypothetical protein